MDLTNEPEGWRRLQEMAQRESDPEVLASLIDKMNSLLDHHARVTATEIQHPAPSKRGCGPAVRLEVQTWQLAE
jgi:hypothetical protein